MHFLCVIHIHTSHTTPTHCTGMKINCIIQAPPLQKCAGTGASCAAALSGGVPFLLGSFHVPPTHLNDLCLWWVWTGHPFVLIKCLGIFFGFVQTSPIHRTEENSWRQPASVHDITTETAIHQRTPHSSGVAAGGSSGVRPERTWACVLSGTSLGRV